MLTVANICEQINRITEKLIEVNLSIDQNFPIQRTLNTDYCQVTFPNFSCISISMKEKLYTEIYHDMVSERAYNIKFPDGGIIQLMYQFCNRDLVTHRLAFFPSPFLDEFQNHPEIYLEDILFSEICTKRIVPFPVRFDYSSDEANHKDVIHPKSHLTLGQYSNCRIPVSSPVTPYWFISFILRNFYHTPYMHFEYKLPSFLEGFSDSISENEKKITHLRIPNSINR